MITGSFTSTTTGLLGELTVDEQRYGAHVVARGTLGRCDPVFLFLLDPADDTSDIGWGVFAASGTRVLDVTLDSPLLPWPHRFAAVLSPGRGPADFVLTAADHS